MTAAALPVISAVVTAAGVGYSAYSANQAANYQAAVAKQNAKVAENNAIHAVNEAAVNARDKDQENKAIIGQLLADQAASGLNLGSGSFALQRKSAEELSARDRQRTIYAGAVTANRYRQQGADFEAQAKLSKMEARNAAISGVLGVGGSLLSSAGKIQAQKAARIGKVA